MPCTHAWILDTGNATTGTCRHCGAVRSFDGGYRHDAWMHRPNDPEREYASPLWWAQKMVTNNE